jgi:cyclase
MLKKRLIISLTFKDGVLFRTKNFKPDYRYTKNFIDLWSIDELIIIDVSKKKNFKKFLNIIKFFSKNCFVPITVGGGLYNLNQIDQCFNNGADKILLGSRSIDKPELITEISKKYGNQSIIQSVDFKKIKNGSYVIMSQSGTKISNSEIVKLCKTYIKYGVGEILLNDVNNDGSLLGFDVNFLRNISTKIKCPIIVLGGAGKWEHILEIFIKTNIQAACTQNIYHFTEESIISAKKFLKNKKINIRI